MGSKAFDKRCLAFRQTEHFSQFWLVGWRRRIFPMWSWHNDILAPSPALTWSCLEFFLSVCLDLCSKRFEDPPQHPKKNGLAIGRVLVIQMIVWINRHGVIKMIRIWRVRDGPAPKGVYSERSISRWWFRFFKIYPYLETRSTGLKTTN